MLPQAISKVRRYLVPISAMESSPPCAAAPALCSRFLIGPRLYDAGDRDWSRQWRRIRRRSGARRFTQNRPRFPSCPSTLSHRRAAPYLPCLRVMPPCCHFRLAPMKMLGCRVARPTGRKRECCFGPQPKADVVCPQVKWDRSFSKLLAGPVAHAPRLCSLSASSGRREPAATARGARPRSCGRWDRRPMPLF